MRVVVAGGTGFIGRATVDALLAAGHEVLVIGRSVQWRELPAAVKRLACDLGASAPPAEALRGWDAVVNLVGIAVPRRDNTFERAHVRAVEHLVEACRQSGIRRLVHVSVVDVGASGPYHETKRAGEARVRDSALDVTVLRPALVYGPGDDMMTRLVQLVRLAPIFPVPAGEPGMLQVVDVEDVALAIVRTLERPRTRGRVLDVVGPERLSLAALVERVASAMSLRVVTPPAPRALMRLGAWVMERLPFRPLVTRSQLGMLVAGLYGDGTAAREALDLTPRPLTAERVASLAPSIGGPSLRVVTAREHRAWLDAMRPAAATTRWMLPLALVALVGLPFVVEHVFARMALVNAILAVAACRAVPLPWRALVTPTRAQLGWGLALAAMMFVGARGVMALLETVAPAFIGAAGVVFSWMDLVHPAAGLVLLVGIVIGEDLVWRGAVTLPLAACLGPLTGALVAGLAFALAHLTSGPPILWLAAALAGTTWSVIAIRTRSLVPVIVSHVTWDLAMVVVGA